MTHNMQDALECFENVLMSVNKLKEEMDELGWKFWYRELVENQEYLMSLCPFKVGDQVTLIREPDWEKAPGWRGFRKTMVPGAKALVKSVSCRGMKGFYINVSFGSDSVFSFPVCDFQLTENTNPEPKVDLGAYVGIA